MAGRLAQAVRVRGGLNVGARRTAARTSSGFNPGAAFTQPGGLVGGLGNGLRVQPHPPGATNTSPANPATPAAATTPAPVDPQYDAEVLDAAQARTRGLASVQQRAQALGQDFGYGVNFDTGTGTAAAGTEDASNPFSRRLLLQRAYATQRNVTGQSMGAQGQLYSGALENQNASDRFSNQAQQDQMQRAFEQGLAGLSSEGAGVVGGYNTAVNVTAPANRLARAAQTRPEDPGSGYDAYAAQARQNQATPLAMQQWIDQGHPTTTTTGRGAFGGGRLAQQFNGLPAADQQGWQAYFAARGSRGQRVLLPSQWIAAGRPKS